MATPLVARPGTGEYLMSIAIDVAARCNCRKRPVGAVIVREGRIISTGYNGTIVGFKNCIDGGCPRCADSSVQSGTQLDQCICVHAEQNALLNAARFGVSVAGADCYVTTEPCLDCTKSLIQSRISRVFYWKAYSQASTDELRRQMRGASLAHTTFIQWEPDTRVLDLDSRYREIEDRLSAYVANQGLIHAHIEPAVEAVAISEDATDMTQLPPIT